MLTNINHLLLFFQSQTTTKYTNQNQIHTNHPLLHDKDQQKPAPDLLLLTIIPSSNTTTCVSVSVDFFFQVVSIIYIYIYIYIYINYSMSNMKTIDILFNNFMFNHNFNQILITCF